MSALLLAASSACAAFLVAPPQLITRPRAPAATAARRIAAPVRASAAALLPSGSSGIDSATAAGRAVGRAVEPLLVVLRWLRSRLLALLGWLRLGLRLGRRAPAMGAVLPVGCVILEMQLVRGNATRAFEPPSMLLPHFGYGVSPFYAALRAPRAAPDESAAAEAAAVAAEAAAAVRQGVRWLQRGAGPPPRHWVDVAADESRLDFLQELYDEEKVGKERVRAGLPWAKWFGGQPAPSPAPAPSPRTLRTSDDEYDDDDDDDDELGLGPDKLGRRDRPWWEEDKP